MASVLTNLLNPGKNLFSGNFRAVADPLKIAGDPDKKKTATGAPEEPDFMESYEKGVEVDTNTLAKRRLIDAAAQLGGVFYDGQVLTQDQYKAKIDFENQKLAAAQASGDTRSIAEAQAELTKLTEGNKFNFAGAGSAELAQADLLAQIQGADTTTRALLDLESKYGPEAAALARANIQATDPTGFALREKTGENLLSGGNSLESMYGSLSVPQYESFSDSNLPQYQRMNQSDAPALQQLSAQQPQLDRLRDSDLANLQKLDPAYLPQFDSIRDGDLANLNSVNGVSLRDSGQAAAGRSLLEQKIFDELAQSGQPDAALTRGAEQAARARGASSGNILGDSSALQESLRVQLAQRGLDTQRRQEALGLLSSGQTTSDKANELAQLQLQNDMASTGFNNQASQQGFANRSSQAAFNNTAAQQGFSNRAALNDNNNSLEQQGYANRINQAGFNNDASQIEYGNSIDATGFNNNVAQQGFANKGAIIANNNMASDQAFNAAMSAINQRNQTSQNSFAAQNQLTQQRAGARQQDMANTQSFLGLQPVSAQAGGYENISAPFNPGNVQPGALSNPNAGQLGGEWYSQLFGAQNQMYAGQQSASAAAKAGKQAAAGQIGGAAAGIAIMAI